MKYERVIKNGKIVSSTAVFEGDLAFSDGKIAALGRGLSGEEEIDASGKLVTPGAVDMHVHLQMDAGGPVSSDDFFEGTRAAACGGTTTIVDFVEPERDQSLLEALAARRAEADPKVVIDYGLHMTIGPEQMDKLDEIAGVLKAGTVGFKMYMAYGLKLNDGELLRAMKAIGAAGGMPIIHAENWDVIQALTAENIAAGRTVPEYHPESRPAIFEAEAVARAIRLARYAETPLHIFHISCGAAVEEAAAAAAEGFPVTAETCPQYLFLTKALYQRPGIEGALPVCSPPLRGEEEQQALWRAVESGKIDVISTDHCPFTKEEKAAGLKRFDRIPGGVPSIEMRFAALFSGGVRSGRISLSRWVELCCRKPAGILGLKGKGDIAPGMDADVVIFDPEKVWTLSPEALHETAGWTPYQGLQITGKTETVFSRGKTIVKDGEFLADRGQGRFISKRSE